MTMTTTRLEAFSDGVIAIIITIMVLELKVPVHAANFADLLPILPVLLSYVMSFIYVGIYWVNHHHMIHAVRAVTGGILWANLHLLFWLSLVPFVTGWMGVNEFAPAPTALYGGVLCMAGVAYIILEWVIVRAHPDNVLLARAVGRDRKAILSVVFCAIAIAAAFFHRWLAGGLYALVALMWLVPDPRITRAMARSHGGSHTPGA